MTRSHNTAAARCPSCGSRDIATERDGDTLCGLCSSCSARCPVDAAAEGRRLTLIALAYMKRNVRALLRDRDRLNDERRDLEHATDDPFTAKRAAELRASIDAQLEEGQQRLADIGEQLIALSPLADDLLSLDDIAVVCGVHAVHLQRLAQDLPNTDRLAAAILRGAEQTDGDWIDEHRAPLRATISAATMRWLLSNRDASATLLREYFPDITPARAVRRPDGRTALLQDQPPLTLIEGEQRREQPRPPRLIGYLDQEDAST